MNKNEIDNSKFEILVYAFARRDAELTVKILTNAGFFSRAVFTFAELTSAMSTAGALIFSEESLNKTVLTELRNRVLAQPSWSDIPIITITSGGSSSTESNERLEWISKFLQNVTLLERPVRLATLITVVRAALSSRKKQFELKDILEDLERSQKASEEANQAKSIFLANMSHEIRTPLAAIVGFAGLMRDHHVPVDERLQFADVIARNADQLFSLINDVLDLSKVEAGKVEVELIELSLPAFIAEVTSWLRPMVEGKGLAFRVDLKSKLPKVVKADSTRIRQVLLNLVSNAVKFTSKGLIAIEVDVEAVSPSQSLIKVRISDTGIGMREEDQSRLFKPFSQADSSVTRRFGGTGLGLVLSKALAQAMGGDLLLARSEVSVGSQFEFRFPVEVVTDERERPTPSLAHGQALAGMRVLLVEDSPDNQFLMCRFLKSAGADVVKADDGQAAIEVAVGGAFDVVLMDIQMPVLDGLSATRELRRLGYKKPIVALTAHALREEKERSLSAGCNDHLTKPIDRNQLIETVAALKSKASEGSALDSRS